MWCFFFKLGVASSSSSQTTVHTTGRRRVRSSAPPAAPGARLGSLLCEDREAKRKPARTHSLPPLHPGPGKYRESALANNLLRNTHRSAAAGLPATRSSYTEQPREEGEAHLGKA